MARRNPVRRRFQWHRSTGESVLPYLAADLFEQSRVAFDDSTIGTACTVVAVKGYIRAVDDSATPTRCRAAIRVCDRNDILDQDPQHGPSNPTVPQVSPNTGAWDDWMGYFPFMTQGAGNVVGEATWNRAASPWAIDVQSSRRIDELNQTLGLFLDSPGTPTWNWDLSIGIKLL